MKLGLRFLSLFGLAGFAGSMSGAIVQFAIDFSTSAPDQVITAPANITISPVTVSAGSISYVSFGTTFGGIPAAESGSGWMTTTDPLAAKNYSFTITADPGYTFSLLGVSSLVRSTGSGPSDAALIVEGSVIDMVATPNEATPILSVSGTFTDEYESLTSATIRIAGYDGGSRSSSGGGVFRIGQIEGSMEVIPEPASIAALLGLLALGLVFWRRRSN